MLEPLGEEFTNASWLVRARAAWTQWNHVILVRTSYEYVGASAVQLAEGYPWLGCRLGRGYSPKVDRGC